MAHAFLPCECFGHFRLTERGGVVSASANTWSNLLIRSAAALITAAMLVGVTPLSVQAQVPAPPPWYWASYPWGWGAPWGWGPPFGVGFAGCFNCGFRTGFFGPGFNRFGFVHPGFGRFGFAHAGFMHPWLWRFWSRRLWRRFPRGRWRPQVAHPGSRLQDQDGLTDVGRAKACSK